MNRNLYTRREALVALSFLGFTASCTPIKVLFADRKPEEYTYDITLRAFMETIIPGISSDSPNLTHIFSDPYFPFAPYKEILAEDLDRTSFKEYKVERFYNLDLEKREQLVCSKLKKSRITQQIYFGALWLTQLAVYTGINNPDGACEIIDFKCMDSKTDSYANPISYLGKPATINGNPS